MTGWPDWIAAYPYCNSSGQSAEPRIRIGGPIAAAIPGHTCNIWQYGNTNWSGGDSDVFNGNLSGFVQTFVIGAGPCITNQPPEPDRDGRQQRDLHRGRDRDHAALLSMALQRRQHCRRNLEQLHQANAQLTNAGTYTVTVTNAYGTTNSANAVLTVHGAPVITAQPTNIITGLGLPASFTVAVSGSTPLSYQWSYNGGSLPGATTSSLHDRERRPDQRGHVFGGGDQPVWDSDQLKCRC